MTNRTFCSSAIYAKQNRCATKPGSTQTHQIYNNKPNTARSTRQKKGGALAEWIWWQEKKTITQAAMADRTGGKRDRRAQNTKPGEAGIKM
eukprot:c48207_g1_i1 orf=128-400(+)